METLENIQAPSLDFNTVFLKMYEVLTFFTSGDVAVWWDTVRLWLLPFAILISIALLAGIVYAHVRIGQIEEAVQLAQDEGAGEFTIDTRASDVAEGNPRWQHVETLIESPSETDWRAAILEADIMLDELVTKMGYQGESLGEKMKGIEKSDFTSINAAWEAHKVRNHLAHEGSTFILTQREAERVVELYREVFREFEVI